MQIPPELREGAQDTMIAQPERKPTLPDLVFPFEATKNALSCPFFLAFEL